MTTQAGGYSASGSPLTAWKALASAGAHAVAARGAGRGQQHRAAHAEPGPGIGQLHSGFSFGTDHSRCFRPGRRPAAGKPPKIRTSIEDSPDAGQAAGRHCQ